MKAHEHLDAVREIIASRGEERDLPGGERSMARAVSIFNASTGRDLNEADGWLFMMALKVSRSRGGRFKLDDYHDLIGYAALLAECKTAKGLDNARAVLPPKKARRLEPSVQRVAGTGTGLRSLLDVRRVRARTRGAGGASRRGQTRRV